MAETLGCLIDKLSIVDLKLWHCQEALDAPEGEAGREALGAKNDSLLVQRTRLIEEIDQFFAQAMGARDAATLVAPANKIYGRFRKE
jgi:hypothetical protein